MTEIFTDLLDASQRGSLRNRRKDVDWIDVAEDRNMRLDPVNTVTNTGVAQKSRNYPAELRNCKLLKKDCSFELFN